MGHIQTLDEFLGMLIRRRLLIAVIILAGMIVSAMVALSRPKIYETGAVIQIESPVITGGDAATGGQTARLLQAIEQRLTTRENLTAIIDRHGLFADAPGLTMNQKIAALRQSVTFQSVPAAAQTGFGGGASVSALIIMTRFANPDQAARVANDLAQSMLDLSVASQASRARETLEFFIAEENRIRAEMQQVDADLAAYKGANAAALPGSAITRSTERATLEAELRRLEQAMVANRGARMALEGKGQLRETDRRRIAELDDAHDVLGSQRASLQDELQALLASSAESAGIEKELSAFDRTLQQLQAQFAVITARRAEAETALRLEEQQRSEHFTLLERATVPEYPSGGGGKKLAVLGTAVSIFGAIGLAFLLDLMNPVLRMSSQMERQLGIRPVIAIPELHLERSPSRRGRLAGLLGIGKTGSRTARRA